MNLMSNSIILEIAQEIAVLPVVQYSITMDGMQDISGVEQVSFCVRYVDTDLESREEAFMKLLPQLVSKWARLLLMSYST